MQTCDICHGKLGFMNRFRYAEGCVCKQCYQKASRQFTETITGKSYKEIEALCDEAQKIPESFEVTGRIGNYLLVDERNREICVLNNRMTKHEAAAPDFYQIEEIKNCAISCLPHMDIEEIERKILERDERIVKALKVKITLKNANKPVEISFFEGAVRIKSFAFRQSFGFAKRIMDEINRLQELCTE